MTFYDRLLWMQQIMQFDLVSDSTVSTALLRMGGLELVGDRDTVMPQLYGMCSCLQDEQPLQTGQPGYGMRIFIF